MRNIRLDSCLMKCANGVPCTRVFKRSLRRSMAMRQGTDASDCPRSWRSCTFLECDTTSNWHRRFSSCGMGSEFADVIIAAPGTRHDIMDCLGRSARASPGKTIERESDCRFSTITRPRENDSLIMSAILWQVSQSGTAFTWSYKPSWLGHSVFMSTSWPVSKTPLPLFDYDHIFWSSVLFPYYRERASWCYISFITYFRSECSTFSTFFRPYGACVLRLPVYHRLCGRG